MNERVKQLRQKLKLSGEKFGEKIGLSKFAISNIEMGKNNLTEQTIKLICHAYNVNEDWLRTGNGEMFNKSKNTYLEDLKKQFQLTELQVNIVKSYLELSDTDKKSIDNFITSCCQNSDQNEI